MRANRTRTTIVALSSLALMGTLAGCSGAQSHQVALAKSKAATSVPQRTASGAPTPTPTAIVTPTAIATTAPTTTTVVKAPTTPVHVAAPAPKPKPKPKPAPPKTTPVTYRDGSYSELGSYLSPGGTETIRVAMTLAGGLVKTVSVTTQFADPTAQGYENEFSAGISAAVVGRPIATLTVGAVGGSSLTGQGFNKAVASIRDDAKS